MEKLRLEKGVEGAGLDKGEAIGEGCGEEGLLLTVRNATVETYLLRADRLFINKNGHKFFISYDFSLTWMFVGSSGYI